MPGNGRKDPVDVEALRSLAALVRAEFLSSEVVKALVDEVDDAAAELVELRSLREEITRWRQDSRAILLERHRNAIAPGAFGSRPPASLHHCPLPPAEIDRWYQQQAAHVDRAARALLALDEAAASAPVEPDEATIDRMVRALFDAGQRDVEARGQKPLSFDFVSREPEVLAGLRAMARAALAVRLGGTP